MTALAVLALFAGLASAQVSGNTQLQCSTNVSVTPQLRVEGLTEQTGDIVLTCTGGAAATPGSPIPQVNISLQLNAFVTSRLLPMSTTPGSPNASESLLLIDEPGSGLPGYGPSLAQKICLTPTQGCLQYVGTQAGPTLGTAVTGPTPSTTFGENVFQGIVTPGSNQVTFFGIPVLPPVTAGASRVFRITNVRVNATTLGATSASGATPVIASISTSGAASLLILNPTPTIGFVLQGLTASSSGSASLNQCTTATRASASTLTFNEGFGTAFKTRVAAQTTGQYSGQSFPLLTGVCPSPNPSCQQNIPGQIYNSESNFILGGMAGNSGTAGLADFGTRLKATFTNIPAGIPSIFVSTTNVFNNGLPVTPPTNPGGSAANSGSGVASAGSAYVGYAVLVSSETASDGNAGAGFFPSVTSGTFAPGGSGNVPVAEIPVVNGTATAVWEVLNTNPSTQESLKFAVYTSFTAAAAAGLPGAGTASVSLSFAPTPPAFPASSGGIAQPATSNFTIPRFLTPAAASSSGVFTINICRTVLLYPYVTNFPGFETGLAVANVSNDSGTGMTTGAQSGKCTFNFYQAVVNPPPFTSPDVVPAGTVYANTVTGMGNAAGSFTGYVLAVCNFQFAHGFAFISDLGVRNFAEGYLAIVLPDAGTGSRTASPPCQGISGCTSSGEQDGH